jgi:hypothetical protein
LYASDHDIFAFLIDDQHPVEVPGLGEGGVMYRGFYVWNSEVGDKTFGLSTFMVRRVCDNRILWGVKDQTTLRIRHTSGAPGRFLAEAMPALRSYSEAGTAREVAQIQAAAATEVAKDAGSAIEWLRARGFTGNVAKASVEAAEREEGRAASVWDLMNGVTALARGIEFQDERVALERKAGELISVAVLAARSARR